ncbi:polysaccharide deacetylase [Spiribacter vilamensis]|uniref:Polysaccharide deacetylase n=2 Tax=Spiribacter vilamensis TaxID=531306 RepID=A0A4Q8D2Q6_9GAMM|nr:polysaccharide deacetylase [Spiribacter vilamensis]
MMASLPVSTCSSDRPRRRAGTRLTALLALVVGVAGAPAPALAADPPAAAPETVASVLMYHRVGNSDHPATNITTAQFRAHLDYLQANDFEVVPLARVVEAMELGESLPPRTVAITFDDGYRSVGDTAHGLLTERGWPYTVFVNTGPVDAGMAGHMDWDRMRELAADGVRFGNHSQSHNALFFRREGETRPQWRNRIRADLTAAQARLREELGDAVHQSPPLLAYPYGEYSLELMDQVAELGFVAFGQQSGAIGLHANYLALPRFSFNERYSDLDGFAVKVRSRAMPVTAQTPLDPVRMERAAPRLSLALAPNTDMRTSQMACYYEGERLTPEQQGADGRFVVKGEADLPVGRSRYNCTAPDADGRFFWFSQLWVVGDGGT